MLRMKRFIAGFLCMVMLFTSVPFEAFATETSEETPSIESLVEAAMNSNSTPAAVDVEAESTEPTVVEDEQTVYTEEETEPTDPTEVETEPTDPTEEETEPTDPTEEETEPTDPTEEETEPTEPTEEETEPTEPTDEEPRWIYSVNDEGYAVIEGYTDYTVNDLSIPYTIDGYYVVAIGEKAFVNNTALTKMYVHGNVQTIAANAFDGLGLALSGYNGTAVMSYAYEQGFDFRLRTGQDYLKFTDKVIDYSYAQADTYSYIDATTIRMALPEALQLSVGSFFFLPDAYEDLLGVYEVLSVVIQEGYAVLSVQNAPYEEVLASLSISGEELHADWSQAEWEDGVEIVEEKWSSSLEGSINIGYKKELGKNKVSWPGSDGEKVFGESGAEFFIEGKFALKGTATVDVDIGLFSAEVKDMSLILEPSLNVKTGIKFDIVDNKSVNTKTPIEMVKPKDYTYKIGSVPLVSASGVLTVKTAIYAKVSASGEVTITFGGQGELGFKWNKNKSDFDGVNKWKWNTPTINGSVTVEVGPCYAVELHCAVLGKVVSVELFAGGVLEAKATIHFGAGGSTDVNTGQTSSTELGICSDIDLDGKVSVTLKLELDLLKKVVGKKGEVYSQTGYSWELFSAKKDIWDTHWEWRKDFIGFLDDCTYETTNTVRFCTFTTEQLKSLEVMYNATFPEPELKEVTNNKLLGWYTDKNYTDQWDFKEDKVTADMTLYAKWEKSNKTVAFVTQDDQVGATDWTEQYVPGSYVTEPAVRIKQWKLNGWYLDEELTDQWDFTKDVMPNKDLTLYGSWTYDENYDPFTASDGKNYTISGGKLYYNGHVYQHVATYELFSAARADAESQGAYLVTISSKEEMDAVLDYVQADCAQQTLWLGINSTTDWKYWLNGEKMTYWNGEDPETTSSQYNGIFYRANGDWDTYDNGSTSHYIMEWGDYTVDPGFAQYTSSSTDGSAQYTVSDSGDSMSVVGFAGGEEVNISNIYDGLLVTEIDAYAFQNNTTVKSITIPSTVEKIGNYAFTGCTALEEITIPASVTSIGTNAFEGCTSLKKVTLPDGITVLPASIFRGCTNLKEILNTEDLTEIQQYAFYGCTSLESFTVPSKLTTIGMYAFSGCSGLKKIVFNSEITTIGRYAFQGCTNLSGSITIPKTCTSIGYDAFYNCSSLDHVFLSCNRSVIGSDAFYGVNATFHGKPEDGIDTWCKDNNKKYINTDGLFRVHFMPLKPTTLPVVPGVKDETMVDDVYLASGTYITEPVITMEGYILEGWYLDPDFTDKWDFARDKVGYDDITLYAKWVEESSIFKYYVEAGNAYISEYNGSDENVVIPATLGGCTVVGIAAGAFTGLETVKSISIPAKVSSIEAKAFEGCLNLYTIAFPQGNDNFTVTNGILYSADMTELIYVAEARTFTSFVVPDSVVRIYGGAFGNHADLTKVEIPASVVEIGENAFPTSSFLTVYGPDAECAAKKYANDNGLGYNEYLVTFYDGSNILFSSVIETGELLVEFAEFESEYATYAGWYRDSACTVAWDFATDTMPASNLNLYLKWNSDFAVENGTAGLTITQYVGTNSTIVIPEKINDTTVTGIAANAFVSTADAPIISVSIPDCVTEIAASAITGNPAPTVIADAGSAAQAYAEADGLAFEKKAYMVSFEVNGGAEIPPIALIPGETAVLPVPIKSNNHFLGWYTTNFYTTAWTDTTVMPEEDITLYARWQVINSQVNNDFSYAVAEDGNAVITGYHGTKSVLSIPSTINGYPVTAIGDFAFAENKTVLTYIIPSTVLTIGEFAFSNSAIERITGGSGVVSIGESCFSGANALRTPFIPDGIKEIPGYCFEYCMSFTDVLIPDTITAIGDYAFYGCNFLSNAEISESVTQIGTGAFAGCESLKSVNVPSSLKGLGNDVFGSAEVHYFAANSLRIISVKQLTKDSIQISWNEVANADGYRLYRKKGTSGDYLLIKSITDTTTSNYSLTSGVTYYYKVVAYEEGATGTTILAESDEHMIRVARMSTPTISSVQIASSESANMNWAKVDGAEGYEVWRAYELNGEYSLLKTVTDTVTTNSGLVGGRTYFYKVRAFYNDGSTTEYSSFSDVYQFTMPLVYMNIPKNVTVRQTATGTVLLEWDPVEGADGYNIYRKRGNGNLSLVKTTQETSTYNYNLVLGETYSYAVEAYCNTDKDTITGQKSNVVSVSIGSLATPYVKSVSQSAVKTALVSWTNISAADGYELWRSRTENGTYSLMKSVTGTATSNYNLSVGGTYYYKVRAYVTDENGENVYSAYSNAVPITILSVAKTRLKSVVQADATSAKVTWAYMSGAKSYEVWRSVNDNEHFELIRTTSGTAIQDRNLIDGQTYFYKVRAYDDSGETVVYGDFSDELYLCIIGAPVIATLEQNSSNSVFITWDKVKDANGYELSRSTDGSNYASVKTIEAASTYNYNLTIGTTYYYKVRAYKLVNDTKVYGNYSKPMSVKILGTPDVTSLLQNGKDGVKLAWSVDDYADGYELWRTLTEDKGIFTKVKNVTGTSTTSFGLHETVATYKLRSYATVNGKKVYGPFGDPMSITMLGTPTFQDVLQASTSSVTLSWNDIMGATSYKVYRSSSPDTGFTLIKTVTGTETTTYSLKSGNTYYFKLKAVMNENGVAHEGAYSEAVSVYVSDIVAPYIKNCNQTAEGVVITATLNGTVDGIELWRADTAGTFTQIADSVANTISDTTCYGGNRYQYKIRSYKIVDDVRVYSAFSGVVSFDTLATPILSRASQTDQNTVYLKWTCVDGATKYEISRSADNGENYTSIGTFEGDSAEDTITATGTYLYRIRASATAGSTTKCTEWSSDTSVTVQVYTNTTYPETPHNYSNNLNQIYTYTQEGAEALAMTFSSASNTESGYDYIYVLDGNGQCVARLTGSIGGKTLVTTGDTFQLYFTSDSSGTKYGFSFDSITEASLDDVTEAAYSWRISGNTIFTDGSTITGLTSRSVFNHLTEVVVVPGATTLATGMTENITSITKVTLPEGLVSIGDEAFRGCTGITEINIPNTVTSIGDYAFYGCSNLASVDFPASLTAIGDYAFAYCTAIQTIVIPETVKTINSYAFQNCTSLTDVTLSTVTDYGYYYNSSSATAWGIFDRCTNLTNVTFSDASTNIDGGLFAGSGIKKITIPATVTEIGAYTFANCAQLTDVVYAGNAVTKIGEYAFASATALTAAPIPDGISEIGSYAFARCSSIKSVTIPDTVPQMNTRTFENCTALTDVIFKSHPAYTYNNNGAKAYGMFNGCSNLTNVTFDCEITRIGNGLFAGSGIKKITIPATVTEIGNYTFSNCTKLTDVVYAGNEVTKIGTYAFASATALTTAPIPDEIKEIGDYAFSQCSAIKSVTIPDTVPQLNNRTFDGCTALTNVIFKSHPAYKYTYNGTNAYGIFNGCTNLTNVTFDCEITRIGKALFAGSGIKQITIPAAVTEIGDYAFANCNKLQKVIYEGDAITALGNYVFSNCTALISAPIPTGITAIGTYAYYNCAGITEVALNDNITSIGAYAFANCSGLTKLDLPESMTKIDSKAFENCTGLTDLRIPASFGAVSTSYSSGRGVFNGCTALTNITFEEGITKIPAGAFAGSGIREIVIPETVTEIGSYAFSYCTKLRTMELPEGLTTINSYAFQNCTILKRFTLPSTLTALGSYVFQYCTDLTSVTVPSGITVINSYLFRGCTSLNTVVLSGPVTTINDYAFNGCSNLKNITIPGTVTAISSNVFNGLAATTAGPIGGGYDYEFGWTETIPANAFRHMSKLTSAVIPEGIIKIGNDAFSNSSITSISLPTTLKTIADNAFYNCDGLTSIVIPEGTTTIGNRAFYGCNNLKNISMPGTVTSIADAAFEGIVATTAGPIGGGYDYEFGWTEAIPASAFRLMSKLTNAVIPEGITSIGSHAFYSSGITSISLPTTLKTIADNAFYNCDGLTSIVIPNGVTSIGNRAFYSCGALKQISMPGTVTSISDSVFEGVAATTAGPIGGGYDYEFGWTEAIPASAFRNMSKLTNAVIPEGITTIGSHAFYNSGITSISLPTTLKTISDNAFYNCDGLTSMVIPEGTTTIGNRAFYGCNNLKNISMPGTVTSIADYAFDGVAATTAGPMGGGYDYEFGWTEAIPASAFRYMSKITNAVIPEGITTIGSHAFYNSSITSISLPTTLKTISDNAFYNCDGLTSIVIPQGTITIGFRTFYNSGKLASVTIPDTVTAIGNEAFTGCSSSLILYCTDDSYAASYAASKGIAHQNP